MSDQPSVMDRAGAENVPEHWTARHGKSIIFVSEGPRGSRLDMQPEIADVVRAANESNTAIYAMDPRGALRSAVMKRVREEARKAVGVEKGCVAEEA